MAYIRKHWARLLQLMVHLCGGVAVLWYLLGGGFRWPALYHCPGAVILCIYVAVGWFTCVVIQLVPLLVVDKSKDGGAE